MITENQIKEFEQNPVWLALKEILRKREALIGEELKRGGIVEQDKGFVPYTLDDYHERQAEIREDQYLQKLPEILRDELHEAEKKLNEEK